MIIINCVCGQTLSADEENAGRTTKCPVCGHVLKVPKLPSLSEAINQAEQAMERKEQTTKQEKGLAKLRECLDCGKMISRKAQSCPHCGRKYPSYESRETEGAITKKQVLGFVGSIILFVGVFMPVVGIPIIASMNYLHNVHTGKVSWNGIVVICLAVISFFLTIAKKYSGLWFTGLACFGMFILKAIEIQAERSKSKLFGPGIQFEWGWAVLIIGAVLLLAASGIEKKLFIFFKNKKY
ncbi:hypothetical protein ES705_45120 [subsurface metagenome]